MGIENTRFMQSDVYMDYDYESVLFRFEKSSKRFFHKFYGEKVESEVPHDNKLLNDAILFGSEIEATAYLRGR